MTTQAKATIAQPAPTSAATPQPLLRGALRADAIFSAVSGAAIAAGSAPLAALSGLPAGWLLAGGLALLAYGAALWWEVGALPLRIVGWAVVALNTLWVLASAAALAQGWLPLTSAGWWLVLAVAVLVDLFAAVQIYALLRRR